MFAYFYKNRQLFLSIKYVNKCCLYQCRCANMLASKYAIICGCCAPASISNSTQHGCTNAAAAIRMGIPCQHACCHSPPPLIPLSLSLFLSHHAGSKWRFWQENVPHDGEKKVFHASPTHFSLPGNIGNHQQRETKRVAGCKLDVVVCLLPVARCRLPVARCLLPGGSVDPGLANYAPRAKW